MAEPVPFGVRIIDHLVLRSGDAPRLVAFYRDVIGLPVERQTRSGLTQLRAGASLVDIVPVEDRDRPGRNLEHFCLRVDPFDEAAIRRHLEAAGAEIVKSGTAYGADGRGPNLYFRDPDGNEVELKGLGDGKRETE
ncbi:MAG TPA: VOC family protein [Alphaproteobacteria bacterium]|jgi:catechol 2,3-dioxygenase-like lactoylglutathione lyase family enzyme